MLWPGGQLYTKLICTENDDSLVIFSSQPNEGLKTKKKKNSSKPQIIHSPQSSYQNIPVSPTSSTVPPFCDEGIISAVDCRPGITPPSPFTADYIQKQLESSRCDKNPTPYFLDIDSGCFKRIPMASSSPPDTPTLPSSQCNLYSLATTPVPDSAIFHQTYWLSQGGELDQWDYCHQFQRTLPCVDQLA